MMTFEEQEAARQERLNEVGTMPPCPICGRARVLRSDYVRCNPCGINWCQGEELDKSASLSRPDYLRNKAKLGARDARKQGTLPSEEAANGGA